MLEGDIMAKKRKTSSKSKPLTKKQIKTLKKLPLPILIFLVLIVGVFLIWQFYLKDNLFTKKPVTYSASQNEEGFYYYENSKSGEYYFNANDKEKENLVNALNSILKNGFTPTSYAEAKTALEKADAKLDDPSKVWNIYDGVDAPAVWDSTSWHREHVWPNARLGMPRVTESGRNQGSDLHNLRAITPRVNSSRGDRVFTNGSGSNHTNDDGGYYPGDDHKGDVARIIFYMYVMYPDILTLTDDLELLNDTTHHYKPEGARMGQLSMLLKWHKEDPVDAFERRRNEEIYKAQGNRNPFIDKPAFAHLIWENKSASDLIEPTPTENEPTTYLSHLYTFHYVLLIS